MTPNNRAPEFQKIFDNRKIFNNRMSDTAPTPLAELYSGTKGSGDGSGHGDAFCRPSGPALDCELPLGWLPVGVLLEVCVPVAFDVGRVGAGVHAVPAADAGPPVAHQLSPKLEL